MTEDIGILFHYFNYLLLRHRSYICYLFSCHVDKFYSVFFLCGCVRYYFGKPAESRQIDIVMKITFRMECYRIHIRLNMQILKY